MDINFYYVLIFGIVMMTFTIIKFTQIDSKYSSPFFTNDKDTFYKNLNINEKYLEKFKDILFYDNFFPIFYSSVFYSLNKINDNFLINIINYTVPIHIILDLIENQIKIMIINNFLENKSVILNNEFFIISSIKWILAGFHTLTSLYSIGRISLKNLNKIINVSRFS